MRTQTRTRKASGGSEPVSRAAVLPESPPPTARQEWRDPATGMTFVFIPPASAVLGSPADEIGRFDDEEPEHLFAAAAGFWLGRTPVTQEHWQAVMGNNPSYFRGAGGNAPVEQVSWLDCLGLVERLNEVSPGAFYAIPSEAEWELACRAGTTGAFYAPVPGYVEANCNVADPRPPLPDLDRMAWWAGNSGDTTHPVAEKEPNPWGLFDMLGNVWEWCWDCSRSGAQADSLQAIRGGPWYGMARCVRCADRHTISPGFSSSGVGVRLLCRRAAPAGQG
jgi:formylglycine-generating enzyme required for sulfatase activity